MIDTHCHLNFKQFDPDRAEVIQRSATAGVEIMINVGTDLPTSRESLDLARQNPNIYSTAGIHPNSVETASIAELEPLARLLREQKMVALGEIGLDFYDRGQADKRLSQRARFRQIEFFEQQCLLAREQRLPVVLHCREAASELTGLILQGKVSAPGVLHCFSGDKGLLRAALDKGFMVSFTANITYPAADDLREFVDYAPLEHILLETDSPFLPPQSLRGRRNEPANLKETAVFIATRKQVPVSRINDITTDTAKKLFRIE